MSAPRWVTLPKYMKMAGISREVFFLLEKKGLVTAVKTEGDQWRIMVEESAEIQELKEEIVDLTSKIDTLCNHLGVSV